jgi:hypothetical protein
LDFEESITTMKSSRLCVAVLFIVSSLFHGVKSFVLVTSRRNWASTLPRRIPINASEQPTVAEKELDSQMLSLSFFSFLHQAAMPFADIVSGSFLSRLDATSLGAMGVARSAQVRS